jgi:hypothetical protein
MSDLQAIADRFEIEALRGKFRVRAEQPGRALQAIASEQSSA